MTMLTLFPPTFAMDGPIGNSNGVNNAFRAKYWRYHPDAAAIAAHEVREARIGFLQFTAIAGVVGVLVHQVNPFADYDMASAIITDFLAGMVTWAGFYRLNSRKRDTNITGEATESVIEERYYGAVLETELRDGAWQLCNARSYARVFDPSDEETVYQRLLKKVPGARRWANRPWNQMLVRKALRLQRPVAA